MATHDSRKPRIVVCDDVATIRMLIASYLGEAYELIVLANAEEVIPKAIEARCDLIISDLMMDNLDGYELCRRVKAEPALAHVPVILLTAKTDDDSRATGLEVGADDYLFKPIRPRELKARVASLLRLRWATLEIERSRQANQDILNNIQQAVFTLGPDLRISPEHSKFVSTVFGDIDFAGRPFAEVLAPGEAGATTRQRLDDWFRLVFAQPHLDWEMVSELVDRAYDFVRPTDGSKRNLLLGFRPIRRQGAIERLMVVAEDVTENRTLQRSLERKSKENEDDLEQISELMQLNPDSFAEFMSEAAAALKSARQSLSELKGSTRPKETVDRLFREMHTLKGNARLFRLNVISAKAHWVEETFAALGAASTISQAVLEETQQRVGELEELLRRAESLSKRVLRARGEGVSTPGAPIAVTLSASQLDTLQALADAGSNPGAPGELGQRLNRTLVELREELAGRFFQRFANLAADLARELGKPSPDIQLDIAPKLPFAPRLLQELATPMLHLVRNAVDHGIESPEARVAAGKPPQGSIRLSARQEKGPLMLELADDGKGIDGAALIKAAVQKGLLASGAAERLTREEALQLIFVPGISTAPKVTEVSGRGMGMDAVKSVLRKLGGDIRISSELGKGTRMCLELPMASATEQFVPRYFGQFLLERGIITSADLLKAVELQKSRNKDLWRYAASQGLLSEEQAQVLATEQERNPTLQPSVAVERGLINRQQLGELLVGHQNSHLYIGEALVQVGALQQGQMETELAAFQMKEHRFLGSSDFPAANIPQGASVAQLASLTASLLRSSVGMEWKPGAFAPAPERLGPTFVEAAIRFSGDFNGRFALRSARTVALKLGSLMVGDALTEDAAVAEAMAEFANVVTGNFCAMLLAQGKTAEIHPPECIYPVEERKTFDPQTAALYQVHTTEGELQLLFERSTP
jgi:CheY-like chemotaxis protein/CheY-specific phosphatase CheX/HPt (histidine-containing phosphotransfer) domain-containing protein/two-component sensor histidine kinase